MRYFIELTQNNGNTFILSLGAIKEIRRYDGSKGNEYSRNCNAIVTLDYGQGTESSFWTEQHVRETYDQIWTQMVENRIIITATNAEAEKGT